MQLAVVEFARNVVGLRAGSSEFEADIEHPVITALTFRKTLLDEPKRKRWAVILACYKKVRKLIRLIKQSKLRKDIVIVMNLTLLIGNFWHNMG